MRDDLKRIAATVSTRRGWDFSQLRSQRDPVPWDYGEVARRYLLPTHRVLDIGTGGGEQFVALAPFFGSGAGIDSDPAMIRVAAENAAVARSASASFAIMDARHLAFAGASFDTVLNRQAPFAVAEVARVLGPGGVFVTQQVGTRNTQNIFDVFGWGSNRAYWASHQRNSFALLDPADLRAAFLAAGCHIVAQGEYDVPYRFLDVASLIIWLTAVPLPEPFDIDRHERPLRALIARNRTGAGIETNEHRHLLIVQKPPAAELAAP